MASWRFSVGNLVSRAAAAPAAVSPASADPLLPLSNLGSGYPDEQGGLEWRSDGTYDVDFDLSLLATSSERADAPTGWADLLNLLAGTPGLPANLPDWGVYAGRDPALRVFRPSVQELEVMPGETVKLEAGLYHPSSSTATAARIRVVDTWSGQAWDGSGSQWTDDGVVAVTLLDDAWMPVSSPIAPAVARTERSVYRIIIEPVAASYGAGSYVYASAYGGAGSPALFPELDTVALVGHNLPAGATVELQPQPSGTAIALTPAQPSCYATAVAAALVQTWRLSIDVPAALAAVSPRPIIGEVWLGRARTFLVSGPMVPIGVEEQSRGQLVVKARNRQEIVPDDSRAVAEFSLEFTARDDAAYRQIRDEIARLTRHGADPLVLLPDSSFDGVGLPYHGRIENKVKYTVLDQVDGGSARTFGLSFMESPFAPA